MSARYIVETDKGVRVAPPEGAKLLAHPAALKVQKALKQESGSEYGYRIKRVS